MSGDAEQLVIEPDSSDDEKEELFSDALEAPDDKVLETNADQWRDAAEEVLEDLEAKSDEKEASEVSKEEQKDAKEEQLRVRKEAEEKLGEEELKSMQDKGLELKKSGNELYLSGDNELAVAKYNEALDVVPLKYSEDRSVLLSNRAAAKVKMGLKEAAIDDCSEAIELNENYVKAIFRRAQLYEETDRPHEAIKDFEKILQLDRTHKESNLAVMRLPEKIREKDEKLKAEMMDTLKKLGNVVLKPFGLSTENFNMVQDANTGGYSVQFNK